MYDGQYLQCYKRLFDENGCMLYSALPVIVTMPLQGSSNEKDECECVNEMSFRNAIYTAIDAYRNRSCYDQPLTNPLPKLYHERKEDGDRSRFTVRKKDDAFTKNDTQKAE